MRTLIPGNELKTILLSAAEEYAQKHDFTENFCNQSAFGQSFEGWSNKEDTESIGVFDDGCMMSLQYQKRDGAVNEIFFRHGDVYDLELSPYYPTGKEKELWGMFEKKLRETEEE